MGVRRIVCTGQVSPLAVNILERYGQIEIASKTDERSLAKLMPGAIALFVRGVTPVPASVIESGQDLLVIGRTGTGYDNIDIAAATSRGIPVVFTPGAGARSVAEGTLAMMLSLIKRVPELDCKTRSGEWHARDKTVIGDLQGSVLGIVGLGRIGREVAQLARAFDVRVIAYDPAVSKEAAKSLGAEKVELTDLLKTADIISFHSPLNKETRGMFNRQRLGMVKKGAILLNLARGGLMESLDVIYEGLTTGQLSAAGLDVYPVEPPDISHPIFRHPNVLLTPHAMALSVKSSQAIYSMVSKGMVDVLEGRVPTNVANPEVFQGPLSGMPRSQRFISGSTLSS